MLYKLTVYLKQKDQLLPVHIYYSESKDDLLERSRRHESFNASYVSILITYQPTEAEVVKY